jgi:hypothetical protein
MVDQLPEEVADLLKVSRRGGIIAVTMKPLNQLLDTHPEYQWENLVRLVPAIARLPKGRAIRWPATEKLSRSALVPSAGPLREGAQNRLELDCIRLSRETPAIPRWPNPEMKMKG